MARIIERQVCSKIADQVNIIFGLFLLTVKKNKKTKQTKQTESQVMTVSHKIGSGHIFKIEFPEKGR